MDEINNKNIYRTYEEFSTKKVLFETTTTKNKTTKKYRRKKDYY